MTKIGPVIFHNLKDYEIQALIMQEICKFDVKVNVITNVLKYYMAFTIDNNLLFIDSIQFMKSSLDALVKYLLDNDFKNLSQKFSGGFLELVTQIGVFPYGYTDSFKSFDEKLHDRCKILSALRDQCISEKDYPHAINFWNTLKWIQGVIIMIFI